ncbi:MAG: glycogen/starch synthase [Planctomycetales bacterium]|nr:glycogen/starch synthase [Planctomycetales bacterium]
MSALLSLFDSNELSQLNRMRRDVDAETATIAYCVYENPLGRSGGIYAVAANYANQLQSAGRNVVVLSPFHSQLKTANREMLHLIGHCDVQFGGQAVRVDLFDLRQGDVRWVLFGAEGHFDASGGMGGADPYFHESPEKLLVDSLFASAAIPRVLEAIGETSNLIVHVQDWELAATALMTKLAMLEGRIRSAALVLTSHNPYDHEVDADAWTLITSRRYPGVSRNNSVYQCFMPLFDAPVATVSRVFASDLTNDPLQTTYFANHLQATFRERGIVGIDNGLFLKPVSAFSDEASEQAMAGNPTAILSEKRRVRKAMLAELDAYDDPRIEGKLAGHQGGRLGDLPDDIPVFLMFGRLDPGQKGFDVLSRAIEAMPAGTCRFILTPIVPQPRAFSNDMRELATRRSGDVVVYPFRMERGYMETMAGATFAIMPSLYEPFGAATEPYLKGTPVVGRATGGLCDQIADIDAEPTTATGFLYREASPNQAAIEDEWQAILGAATPQERCAVPLYGAMVASLAATLSRAAALFHYDHAAYGRMLANLFPRASSFSWERNFSEYRELYRRAAS